MKKIAFISILFLTSCASGVVSSNSVSSNQESSKQTENSSSQVSVVESKLKFKDISSDFINVSESNIESVRLSYYASGANPGILKDNFFSENKNDLKSTADFILNSTLEKVPDSEGRRYGGNAVEYSIKLTDKTIGFVVIDNYFTLDNESYYKVDGNLTLNDALKLYSVTTYNKDMKVYKNDELLATKANIMSDMYFTYQTINNIETSSNYIESDFGKCYVLDDTHFSFTNLNASYKCEIVKGNNFSSIFNNL